MEKDVSSVLGSRVWKNEAIIHAEEKKVTGMVEVFVINLFISDLCVDILKQESNRGHLEAPEEV